MSALTHNKHFFDAVSCLPFFGRIFVALFAFFLSACGMESAPLSQDQAMLVINMPHMKSAARAADGVAPAIPAEVTEIRFRVTDTTGGAEAQERVFVPGTKLQFLLAPSRSYTVVGTAKARQELLYEGSETVHTLAPGETRDVAISLLSKIKLALSVSSALQGPQSGPADPAAPIQILVGEGNATDVKVAIDGLVNKAVNWYVNDIPRGNAVLGTVSVDGLYTPPASVPANSVVRIKAVSAAAPSFAAEVTVNLIPAPGVDDPVPVPVTLASPAGGTFITSQTVVLSCGVCTKIHYTLDGNDPTLNSRTYSSPIAISTPSVLKFFGVNSEGVTENVHSERYSFVFPPTAPTIIATAGDGNVFLSWNSVDGATEYKVFRSLNPAVSVSGSVLAVSNNASFTDSGVSNGTTYYYRVVASNRAGESPSSNEVGAKPLTSLPQTVTNVVATAGNSLVTLDWSMSSGATEYRVYRDLVSGAVTTHGALLATVYNPSFVDSGLTNGTTYYYSVIASNKVGNAPPANETSARPLPPLPVAPGNLRAIAGNNRVELNWTVVAGATNYKLFRGTIAGVSVVENPIATVTSPSYLDQTAINGTTYFYAVVATNLAGQGTTSVEAFAKPLPPIPVAPTGLSATIGNGQVVLSWAPTVGATQYRIFSSTNPVVSTAGNPIGSVAVPSYFNVGLTNGTAYYFRVVAVNLGGASPDSAEISATPLPLLPTAPSNFTANVGNTQVVLSWNAVVGATKYRIFRATSSGVATTGAPLISVTSPTYTDLAVVNGTTYYYKTVANNLTGDGPATGEISAKPLPLVPAAPANVFATAANTQIGLSWPNVVGAAEYRVFGGTTSGVQTVGVPLATVTNPFYTHIGLTNGATYFYRIVAVNIAGVSSASSEVKATPLPPLPTAPTNVKATAANLQVQLGWTAVNGATEYRIFRGTSAGVTTVGSPFATTSLVSYLDLSVANGTFYYYAIVAANLAGPGGASAEVSARPLPPLPASPGNVTAAAGNAQVVLNWSVVSGATEYRVFRDTRATVSTLGAPIGTVNVPGFTSSTLVNGTTYYFRVVAVNLAGQGADSAEVSARPLPPLPSAPSNVTAAPSDGHAVLSWVVVAGVTEYRIFRGLSAGVFVAGTPFATATSSPFDDVNLSNGTSYYYRIVAVNIAGAGPPSVEVNAKPLPSLPGAPTAFTIAASDTKTSLIWGAAKGATEYRIYRSTSTGVSVSSAAIKTTSNTFFDDSGLTNGVTYYYKVVAGNVAGVGPASAEMSAMPLPPLPMTPTNLTAKAGDGQATLDWTSVAGATGYKVFMGTSSGVSTANGVFVAESKSSSTISNLTNGTTYYFKVVAVNLAGQSDAATEVSAKPLPPLPAMATNLTAVAGDKQIVLSWSIALRATLFHVFRGTSPNVLTTGTPTATVLTPTFTSLALTNGTAYYFKVVTANEAGLGFASAETMATPLPPLPAAPVNLTANAADREVGLAWDTVMGASEYRIFRGITKGFSPVGAALAVVTNPVYADKGLSNGTTYYYKVFAANLAGPGVSSAEVKATPLPLLPTAPTNFSATAGNSQVNLTWADVSGATAYRVFRGASPNVSTQLAQFTQVEAVSFTDLGLTNGNTYYYVVAAVNLAGQGSGSSEVSAKPLPPKPAAPTGLTATSGDTQVALTWSADTVATEYRVFQSTNPNVPSTGTQITTVFTPSFVVTGLLNGTTYYFNVVAANLAGMGPASEAINAKPLPPLPAKPINVVATAGDGQVTLTWNPASGATEYHVFSGKAPNVDTSMSDKRIGAPTVTSFNSIGLANGDTYYFKIVAVNVAGPSSASDEVNARPIPVLPAAPANLTASSGDNLVTLVWEEATGASEYRIYRSTESGVVASGNPLTTTKVLTYPDTAVTNGVIYYYRVVAANFAGAGSQSNEAIAHPLPPLPGQPNNVSATAGDGKITLTWLAVSGATSYNVFRRTSENTTGTQIGTFPGTSFDSVGLTNDTTYYFKVVAVNVAGAGPESLEVMATPLSVLPAAPTQLTATPGNAQVSLAWEDVTGTEYRIFRSTVEGVVASGNPFATPVTKTYKDSSVVNGTLYYYKVVAVNLIGPGPASSEVSAMPMPPIPGAPTGLIATAGDAIVTLNWSPVPDATGYRIFASETANVATDVGSAFSPVEVNSFTSIGLTNGKTYYYKVVAANIAGTSLPSKEEFAKPLPPLPTIPINVVATPSSQSVSLTWSGGAGATQYFVYRATTANVPLIDGVSVDAPINSYVDTSVTNNTTYYYVVTAANVAGESDPSSEVSAKPGVLLNAVTFADAELAACVTATSLQYGFSFVYELTALDCTSSGISNLTGIEQLASLITINMSLNPKIGDYSPLARLPALKSADLSSNTITEVPDLTNWPSLQGLVLSHNSISDLDGIGVRPTLTTLAVNNNPLESLHPLAAWNAQASLTLNLSNTNLVDVAALESFTGLSKVIVNNSPYLSCNSVKHLDQTLDQTLDLSDGSSTGIVTWTVCKPAVEDTFSFTENGARHGWRQEGLGETLTKLYLAPSPFALVQVLQIGNVANGWLSMTRVKPWPTAIQTNAWFNDLVSPDLSNEPNWQALPGIDIKIASANYNGTLQVQFLLDVTRSSDKLKMTLEELEDQNGVGVPVFHTILTNISIVSANFTKTLTTGSETYVINNIRLRILGDTPAGELVLHVDDIGVPFRQ